MRSTVHHISVKFVLIELRNRRKRQKYSRCRCCCFRRHEHFLLVAFSLFAAFVSNATQRSASQLVENNEVRKACFDVRGHTLTTSATTTGNTTITNNNKNPA